MRKCSHCGDPLARSRRRLWERPIYSVVFKCQSCESRVGAKRNFFDYFGGHAKCPNCGTEDLKKRTKPDKIDKLIKTPISILQSVAGGYLYHCGFCRIQFYDRRRQSRLHTSRYAQAGD